MNPKSSFKAQTFTCLPNKVFQKTKTQLVNPPEGPPILTIELIKKGKITKNKRFFAFFDDRILYYKVNLSISLIKEIFIRIESL